MKAEETVARFIQAMNLGDVDGLVQLMTEDHVLYDSGGNVVSGLDRLRAAWSSYLAMFPDYCVQIERSFADGSAVAIFGRAEATYAPYGTVDPSHHWQIPGAWLAEVKDDRVAVWRVYADTEPIARAMSGGSR
jgi:limonene-1,2-epoxide hydrolase